MDEKHYGTLGLAFVALTLVGCNATGAMTAPDPIPAATASTVAFRPNSDAGLAPSPIVSPARLNALLASRSGTDTARSDPFALTPSEQNFERQQELERVLGQAGGFSVQITPKPEVAVEVVPPEPQPYRRLSGIVVGDSILAIFEEVGKEPVIVTPGSRIPNTEWRVLSIDQDKAVLVRSGKVLPTQVVVRLESPPSGVTTNNGLTSGTSTTGGSGVPGMMGGQGRPGMSGRPGVGGAATPGGGD